jgi:hypothetical protein
MTIVGWMVYAFAISLLMASGAWLLEHGLTRLRLPTRWVWLGALALCLALPAAALLEVREGAARPGPTDGAPVGVVLDAVTESAGPGAAPTGAWGKTLDLVAQWRAGLDRALVSGAALARLGPRAEEARGWWRPSCSPWS